MLSWEEFVARKQPGEKIFWLMTLEECPYQNLEIGGVTFQRYTDVRGTQKRGDGNDWDVALFQIPGNVVVLDEVAEARIRKAMAEYMVGWKGEPNEFCKYGVKGYCYHKDDPAYRPRKGDRAAGETLQMKLVERPEDAPAFFAVTPGAWKGEPAIRIPPAETSKREDFPVDQVPADRDEQLGSARSRRKATATG